MRNKVTMRTSLPKVEGANKKAQYSLIRAEISARFLTQYKIEKLGIVEVSMESSLRNPVLEAFSFCCVLFIDAS